MKPIYFIILYFFCTVATAETIIKPAKLDTTEINIGKMFYSVSEDSTYVYINVRTSEEKTIKSIIRTGLTVYFDLKGKKKKDVFIRYPYVDRSGGSKNKQKSGSGRGNDDSVDLYSLIEKMPSNAQYGFYGEATVFNKDLNAQDIHLGYQTDGERLEFNLQIPKSKIIRKNRNDFTKLSIGVESNQPDKRQSQDRKPETRQGSGIRPEGGRGGGMSGGGREGGMSGVGRGGGNDRPQRGGEDQGEKPKRPELVIVNDWFDGDLRD